MPTPAESDKTTPEPVVPHVVLVDGNDRERSELAELIRAEEYRVTEADNGRKALEALGRDAVDLVLAELLLEDMSGWDLLAKFKEAFPYVHGVVTTGSITEHGEAILKDYKADGYLIKPVQQRPMQILMRALLSPGNLDRPARVVAVDIDAEVLQTIDEVLGARGIYVTPFASVRKAMQHIWNEPPDLVLTEVAVGEESGFDAARKSARLKHSRRSPSSSYPKMPRPPLWGGLSTSASTGFWPNHCKTKSSRKGFCGFCATSVSIPIRALHRADP